MSVAEQLQAIHADIAEAAALVHKNPDDIALIAVSKGQPLEKIRAAFDAGQKTFGENYVQEAVQKITALQDLAIEWHFIGTIQSNKTKLIAEHFDWVQTITRFKDAQRLNDQRPEALSPLNICIEVNISEDPNKTGIAPEAVLDLAQSLTALPRLKLRGLMTIAKLTIDPVEQAFFFDKMAALYQDCCHKGCAFDTLSMGMSGDFALAIAAGSTCVRIGTRLFGQRKTNHG